ncbi:MAG: DUF1329 domain-containing protein [bacterium]|nr:DUF1329 domain-containing protein [bacterium]
MLLTYRYKDSYNPKAQGKNDDTWVYVPTLRRVRRISTAQRTDAVSGTDFTFDDLFSFNGVIPQYEWECLGTQDVVAPVNTKQLAFPYNRDHNFGPYGLSFADDRWELRKAIKIRFVPNAADHPYKYKDIYIDINSMEPLYSFAYDRKGELWKILWHNHRWSDNEDYEEYVGWEGVGEEPRDLGVVSDIIVNVQTGTGNRIEFWNVSGSPMKSKGKIRRYIDVGRLTKGREPRRPGGAAPGRNMNATGCCIRDAPRGVPSVALGGRLRGECLSSKAPWMSSNFLDAFPSPSWVGVQYRGNSKV